MAQDNTSKKPSDNKPEQAKVHVLNANEVHRRSRKAQRRRRIISIFSFMICVALPVVLAVYYFALLAADRYAVETKFAIRSPSATGSMDIMGLVTGMSSATSTTTDSYMVVDFIESRDLIDRLEAQMDIRAIYSKPEGDWLMRLDADATKEDLVEYMSKVISIYFDTSSQILTLEVQAFTPEDAEAVSAAILDISDDLVNEISDRARQDTMRSAEREVARIETLLAEHRRQLAAFRQAEQDIDPAASALEQIGLLGGLERELAGARTRLSSLTEFLSDAAPSVRILQSQIEAMEAELAEQRSRLGTGQTQSDTTGSAVAGGTFTDRVAIYEDLAVDMEFLQQAYLTALAAREAARLEADRQQRYLAAFVRPSLPERALYPQRTQSILIFAGFALMFWAIGVMLVYIVREHSS